MQSSYLQCFMASRRWTRNDSIRTLARTLIAADLLEVSEPPRYQVIAGQAVELRGLGYPDTRTP